MADRWLADPRRDLADGALFARLLADGYALDGADPQGIFGALHGLRCCGARLALDFGRARVVAGEMGRDEYAADRARWLLPRADELRRLLAAVSVPRPDIPPQAAS